MIKKAFDLKRNSNRKQELKHAVNNEVRRNAFQFLVRPLSLPIQTKRKPAVEPNMGKVTGAIYLIWRRNLDVKVMKPS